MTKGYLEKSGVLPKAPEKEKEMSKGEKVGIALGMTFALGGIFAFEALIVWVIIGYLLKAKVAYMQVLGSVLLFEYVLARMGMKK